MYLFWLLSFSVVVLNERRIKEFSQKIHPSSSVIVVAIERRVYRSRMITKWLAEPEIRKTKQKWSRKMKSKNIYA